MGTYIYAVGNEFHDSGKEIKELNALKDRLMKGAEQLKKIRIQTLLDFFQAFSIAMLKAKELQSAEGLAFVSQWMRKSNFEKMLNENLGNFDVLDDFRENGRKYVKAQPRGIAVHWVAGNIQTLALFSLFQSMAVRNANILRLPETSMKTMLKFLRVFSGIKINGISGSELLESVAVVYVPSSDRDGNEALSRIADARIIWGGEDAVKDIKKLGSASHCEDIVFGPKYSFAVVDKDTIESSSFSAVLKNFTVDIMFSEQISCTSPHVIFFEAEKEDMEKIANELAKEFELAAKKYPKEGNAFVSSMINTKRAEFGMLGKKIIASKEMDWTIIIDDSIRLENPVGYRTIFIKPVKSIFDAVPLITRRVQTVGCAISSKSRLLEFADAAGYRGVSRCVPAGTMNFFDTPWDGMYPLSMLVSWAYAKSGKND